MFIPKNRMSVYTLHCRVANHVLIRVPIAIFRMVTCQEKALENLKLGLFDVLPAGSLDSLTAEDFRLLLNGVS